MSATTTSNLVQLEVSYFSKILESDTTEQISASPIDEENGIYQIESMSHYGAPLSKGDLVLTQRRKGKKPRYVRTLEYSGNSTIQVVLLNDDIDMEELQKSFSEIGCQTDRVQDGYFVMNIPENLSYSFIRSMLSDLEEQEAISFAEPWLGPNHQEE
ncbi:MAG: DUF4265 domain-containing protein [Luteibaculum sp.]